MGGGYLVERWVRGSVAQIHVECFFGLSGLPMAPFLGRVFAKCIIFDEFFF